MALYWYIYVYQNLVKACNRKGYYFHIKFEGIGKTIEELEKIENIDEKLIRFLTVKVKKHDLTSFFIEKKESSKELIKRLSKKKLN